MKARYSSRFKKQYKKLHFGIQNIVDQKLQLLATDQYHPTLRNHALQGRFKGYRSIDIQSDLRVVYKQEEDFLYLRAIGSHSELYS